MSIHAQVMYECGNKIADKLMECLCDQLEDFSNDELEGLVDKVVHDIDNDIGAICENYVWDHREGFIKDNVDEWLENRDEEEEEWDDDE